ncbi:carbohydrate ABC transporter permease [Lacrimispora sp.]|uniref:carbohydrate ABC transporter permease n=1 Tax=Lacrimispora sp. TaxID=2719234 RepID=UPI0028A9C43F|nr:sugar ABC transporter permease [Lacrimispora sp.]
MVKEKKAKTRKKVSYAKWGYIFLIPFFATYFIFSLIPLINTFYNSLFENYRSGLTQIGPNFVGFQNYISIFQSDLLKYFGNTLILWFIGFVPQIIISLILAVWFADFRMKLRGSAFFKTIIYMPNVIMAASFAMLIFALFSDNGPMNNLLMKAGVSDQPIRFMSTVWGTRGLIGLMNFMMWFGNTTILLMAAIMGVDASLFEAASIDGAKSLQIFTKVTMPIIRPIFIYVLITSMIGGLQMFDVPQVLTNAQGTPDRTSMTLIMFLNNHLYSKNYGMAGALSVILFLITAVLSMFVFVMLTSSGNKKGGRY